jgi:hypothetical protein
VIDGESYEGEFDAAAREACLRRQANVIRGWKPGGWVPAQELLRLHATRLLDPAHQEAIEEAEEAAAYDEARAAEEAKASYHEAYTQVRGDAELFLKGLRVTS